MKILIDTKKETVTILDKIDSQEERYYFDSVTEFLTKHRWNFFKMIYRFKK